MTIGIEAQRLFRKTKHGMDIVALELIRNLQQIDKANKYVIFVKAGEDNTCIEESDNFKIVEMKKSPFPFWEQVALPLQAIREKCDILHCTSNTAPLFSRIPLVLTLHDIIFMEKISLFEKSGSWYQKLGNMYRRIIVPTLVSKADKIITVSNYEKKRIKNYFNLSGNKLDVVYNGVGNHFLTKHNREDLVRIRNKYHLPENYLFFLGNTHPKKNTKNVLRAFSIFHQGELNDIFLVMPDFKERDLQALLQEIGDPGLREFIHLTGYIDNQDLPVIYNQSRLFLYPSLRESFGIPILEAMASGTPVITSLTSSMPEVAGEAALLVDPNNTDEKADAIHALISQRSLRRKTISTGLLRAQSFNWRTTAEEVLGIYRGMNGQFQSKPEAQNNEESGHRDHRTPVLGY